MAEALRPALRASSPIFMKAFPKMTLDLKLTLSFSIREWDVASPNLEESHEKREREVLGNGKEGCGDGDPGTVDWRQRNDGTGGPELSDRRTAGEAGGNGAKQVLLQPQGADARATGAAQTIEREIDGREKGSRGDREGVRIPVQPGGRFASRVGGVGGGGKQVLPVF